MPSLVLSTIDFGVPFGATTAAQAMISPPVTPSSVSVGTSGSTGERFSPKDMIGQVWLLNVWASWCVSCRDEHPVLVELARNRIVPVVGLNYKYKPAEAKAWLKQFGDPYLLSVTDQDGRVGIDYGVYGVPETFVIDRTGVVRYKQIGPVTRESLESKILPLIRQLQKS